MRILITAGGTSENIDPVRKITNASSGRLGAVIADHMVENGHDIVYVHGRKATLPMRTCEKHPIIGVRDLQAVMKDILTTQKIDTVIHAMAVSDYFVDYVTTPELAAKDYENAANINELRQKILTGKNRLNNREKLSSDEESLMVVLKKSPKVIQEIKQHAPNVTLIGFKLFADATYEKLEAAAFKQIETCGSNLVVANNLQYIDNDKNLHAAWLIGPHGLIDYAGTKQGIAKQLNDYVETHRPATRN